MLNLLLLLVYTMVLCLAGFFAGRFVFRRAGGIPAEWWLPVSFAMGLGIQTLIYSLFLLVLGRVYFPATAALMVALAIGGLTWRSREIAADFQGAEIMAAPQDRSQWGIYWLLLIFLAYMHSLLFANALTYPFTSYDGRAIWNLKAAILFHEQTVFTDAYTDPYRVHYHRNYPHLIPFAWYSLYSTLGEVNERQARFFLSLFFLFQSLFFYGMLRKFAINKVVAVLVPLLFSALAFRDDWSEVDGTALNSGSVDIPLSFFAMVAVSANLLWWREGQRWQWLLAGIFGGLCLLIKAEGIIIVAAMLGANLLYCMVGPHTKWKSGLGITGRVFLGSVLVALLWMLVQRQLPNLYDEEYGKQLRWSVLSKSPERLPPILGRLWQEITTLDKWNFFWLAYLLVLMASVRDWFRRRSFWLDSVLLLWAAAYLFTYLVSPLNLAFHLETSMARLLSHMLPLVLLKLCLFSQRMLSSEWEETPSPQDDLSPL